MCLFRVSRCARVLFSYSLFLMHGGAESSRFCDLKGGVAETGLIEITLVMVAALEPTAM